MEILKFGNNEGIDQKLVKIAPGLWQGSRGPAQDDAVLNQYGITQILSITRATLAPLRKACRWTLSIDDCQGWNKEQIDFVLTFVKFISKNHCNAIVHCDHGASRSSGAITIWRMWTEAQDKNGAYSWLRSINPYASMHPEILNSLPNRF